MDDTNSKVLVCLPFYRGGDEDTLKSVLDTLLELDYPKKDLYLFLIDNTTKDRSMQVPYDFVKDHGSLYWGSEIKRAEGNLPCLRNLGLAKAVSLKCEFIFYVDFDVFLKANTLSELVRIAHDDEKIFSVGQAYLTPIEDEGFIYGTKRRYANFSTLDKPEIVDTPGVGMGATILRISVIEEVGKFDVRIPYIEDLNLHRRAMNLGYRVVLDKRDPLLHKRRWKSWDVARIAYLSGKAEMRNMRINGTWRSEVRSSAYWLLLLSSVFFSIVSPLPLLFLLSIGFVRYFLIARGVGRILLFPAMFLSKVPKMLGLLRASLSRESWARE